jgi:hypothetical protein
VSCLSGRLLSRDRNRVASRPSVWWLPRQCLCRCPSSRSDFEAGICPARRAKQGGRQRDRDARAVSKATLRLRALDAPCLCSKRSVSRRAGQTPVWHGEAGNATASDAALAVRSIHGMQGLGESRVACAARAISTIVEGARRLPALRAHAGTRASPRSMSAGRRTSRGGFPRGSRGTVRAGVARPFSRCAPGPWCRSAPR